MREFPALFSSETCLDAIPRNTRKPDHSGQRPEQSVEQQESELTAHLDQCETCGEELERRVAAADQWQEAGELLTHRTRRSNVVDLANDPSTNASSATSTTFAEQMDQVIGMLAPTESLQANRLKAKQQRIPPRR